VLAHKGAVIVTINYRASPLAKGLFQRAIGESGGLFSPMKMLAEAEKEGEKLGRLLAPDATQKKPENSGNQAQQDVLQALRATPAGELLKAGETETVRTIVDGRVLPQDVATTFAQGKQNDVPLIVGYNADEGTVLAPQGANIKAVMFVAGVHQRYGSQADELLKVYPAASDEQAVSSSTRPIATRLLAGRCAHGRAWPPRPAISRRIYIISRADRRDRRA
jgi:para-nitrobenzyl esterase